jgi:dTDP-4-amino-4,6-dideoxygalactose transaminase
MMKIPYGRQFIDNDDIKEVSKVLKNELITTGKQISKFEQKINNLLKCKFSSACNSGTSALLLAFQSIGLKKNDVVIMPSVTFIASYNVVKLLGAKVFLADVNRITGQMSPNDILNCCKKFKIKKIKAIVTMYNGGYPENAGSFFKLKKKLGCYVIEDACHAFGARYFFGRKKNYIGSCKHSDLCTFSFHPLKTITTGEGGLVTTNSKYLDKRIKNLRSHGITNKKFLSYDVVEHGLNLRLNDFQSALGISQLKKIRKFINNRKKIAQFYNKELKNISRLILPKYSLLNDSSYHLYIIIIKDFDVRKKNIFYKFMKNKGIHLQYHYIPIYKFQIFKDKKDAINSEFYFKQAISLPIYFDLKKNQQKIIIKNIKDYLN